MKSKFWFILAVIDILITLPFRIIGLIGIWSYALVGCIFGDYKFSKCREAVSEGCRQAG